MTTSKKRILLANTVISLLNTDKIIAGDVGYLYNEEIVNNGLSANAGNVDLKFIFQQHAFRACAKGALFVADVLNGNIPFISPEATIRTIVDKINPQLVTIFDIITLKEIERYYEGWQHPECKLFKSNNSNPKKRMIKIMQNIIANKGNFVPDALK